MASLTSSLTLVHRPHQESALLRASGAGSIFTLTVREEKTKTYLSTTIRSRMAEVKLGRVRVEVTPEARALIDRWEGESGAIVPQVTTIAPNQWGKAVVLTAAVAEAIGFGGHALRPSPPWSWGDPPTPWRIQLIDALEAEWTEFARAHQALDGVIHQTVAMEMHLPYLSDRMWDFMSPHFSQRVRERVERHRVIVASGGHVCWA